MRRLHCHTLLQVLCSQLVSTNMIANELGVMVVLLLQAFPVSWERLLLVLFLFMLLGRLAWYAVGWLSQQVRKIAASSHQLHLQSRRHDMRHCKQACKHFIQGIKCALKK